MTSKPRASDPHREPDDGKPFIAVTWVHQELMGRARQNNGKIMTDIWPTSMRPYPPEPEQDHEAEP
jgi:hypothetical protein